MFNISVAAGFNKSKHQMLTAEADTGVALPAISTTHFVLMFKDTLVTFNQVSLKARYFEIVSYLRDNNVLDRINDGEFGPDGHLVVAYDPVGGFTIQTVLLGEIWDAVPTNSVSISIPIDSGWVADGSTTYLTNIAKRVFEKAREEYLMKSPAVVHAGVPVAAIVTGAGTWSVPVVVEFSGSKFVPKGTRVQATGTTSAGAYGVDIYTPKDMTLVEFSIAAADYFKGWNQSTFSHQANYDSSELAALQGIAKFGGSVITLDTFTLTAP